MVTTNEEWRPVPGYTDYEVSNRGQVRSFRTRQGHPSLHPRILASFKIQGYPKVNLGRDNQQYVHRLVLAAFVAPMPRSVQCRHLDGNPGNSDLSNLAWGTAFENYADRRQHGTANDGSANGRAKLTEEIVRNIRSSQKSTRLLAAQFNVSPSTIISVRGGTTWRLVK